MSTAKAFDRQQPSTPPVRTDSPVEMESVDCLLCGARDHETVVVVTDRTRGAGRFRIVRCTECGLHFTNPRPTPGSIGLFYADDPVELPRSHPDRLRGRLRRHLERAVLQARYGYPPCPPDNLWEQWQAKLGHLWLRHGRQRLHWIPFRPPGRLLDFGCRGVQFLEHMRSLGWTVEGLDLCPATAQVLREQSGIPIHGGGLPHPHLRYDSFDAITLWNVLERMHRPREVLRHLRGLLRPGGLLVIGTLNIGSWPFRQFQQEWEPLSLPHQLVHFTPETLRDLLRREGFGVVSIKHVARPSLIQHSSRRAAHAGWGRLWLRVLRSKLLAKTAAHWTERHKQADLIRVVAERI